MPYALLTHTHTHMHTHTQDDEVKYVIQKAMRGEIEVGSYKLPPKLNEYPEKISAAGRLGSSPVTIQGKPKCETVQCEVDQVQPKF